MAEDEDYFAKYTKKAPAADAAEEDYFAKYVTKPTAQAAPKMGTADMLVRFATGGIGIKHGVEEAAKHARGLTTGEIEPTPENVLPAATLALGASPVRLGLGGKAAAPPPRLATTIEELERVGTEAVTKPTGAVVPQAEAGAIVRRAVAPKEVAPTQPDIIRRVDEWPFQKGPATVRVPRPIPEAEDVPRRLSDVIGGRVQDPHVIDRITGLAETSSSKESIAALGYIRKSVPAEEWASVQGATLARLGRTGGVGEAVGFDPIVMLNKYKDISPGGKGILFGESGKAGLRTHLDSLVDDMAKIEKLRIPVGPMDALKEALGMPVPIRYMAEPKTAAPIAQWSKAFTRLFGEGRSPAVIGAFKIATDNLENSLGVKLDRDKLIGAMPEVPRAEQKQGTVYNRGFAGIIGTLAQMPRQLPYEKMRQSANVSDFSRAQPPAPDLVDLLAGRFVPNAEYGGRMLMPGDPADPLPAAVGFNDIARWRR